MAMNKQTKIQIACVLSDIFLTSALRYNDNGEIDKDLTKAYYTRITDKVLSIYPNFSKNDLDSIFPAIAYYCMYKTNLWIFYDDWSEFDKEEMRKELESYWGFNYVFGLFYKYKVQYKYKILCHCFGFSKNEAIYREDREIPSMLHIPLLLVVIGVASFSLVINLQFGLIVLLCIIITWISMRVF